MQIADDAITNDQTEQEIENILFQFCDLLPGLEQECRDFVKKQLPIILDLLVNEYLNPTEVCEKLSLCP